MSPGENMFPTIEAEETLVQVPVVTTPRPFNDGKVSDFDRESVPTDLIAVTGSKARAPDAVYKVEIRLPKEAGNAPSSDSVSVRDIIELHLNNENIQFTSSAEGLFIVGRLFDTQRAIAECFKRNTVIKLGTFEQLQ